MKGSNQTSNIMAALARRYSPPAWALLEQVGDGTGYGVSRHADAVVMGLWPSRGLDLHGIEVKASRGDWLRELKRPEKAEPIAGYCDFWWLAVAPGVVDLTVDAVPQPWGVLVLEKRGLVQHRAAERNPKPEPLDRNLLAAVLRRATERMVPKGAIAGAIEAARDEAYERGKKWSPAIEGESKAVRGLAELERHVAAFEAASGVGIHTYDAGHVGKKFATLHAIDGARMGWAMRSARDGLTNALDQLEKAQGVLDDAATPQTKPEGTP